MPAFRDTSEDSLTGAKTLPQRYFVSSEVFAKEAERIFARHWLCVGHQTQIARPGDYFLQEIGNESLIIVRDRKDKVRSFFNVCRHRGTRLCEQSHGQFHATIQCPYHAWTYTLEGALLGAPHMDAVADFDKAAHSLREVAVELWEGFIFVNLTEQPPPLAPVIAPLAGKFESFESSASPHRQTNRV